MASFITRVGHSLWLIHLSHLIITAAAAKVHIRRGGERLTFAPQDIQINVTNLDLGYNRIKVINSTSFLLLEKMNWLSLDKNPLMMINNNTFDNNPLLTVFECFMCAIKILSASFGPAAFKINKLSWIGGVRDKR